MSLTPKELLNNINLAIKSKDYRGYCANDWVVRYSN